MYKRRHRSRIKHLCMACVTMAIFIGGCTGYGPPPPESWRRIPSFDAVAGRWAGEVVAEPSKKLKDNVFLSIEPKGPFVFVGEHLARSLLGAGTFLLDQGILVSDKGGRMIHLKWYEVDGHALLGGRGSKCKS